MKLIGTYCRKLPNKMLLKKLLNNFEFWIQPLTPPLSAFVYKIKTNDCNSFNVDNHCFAMHAVVSPKIKKEEHYLNFLSERQEIF